MHNMRPDLIIIDDRPGIRNWTTHCASQAIVESSCLRVDGHAFENKWKSAFSSVSTLWPPPSGAGFRFRKGTPHGNARREINRYEAWSKFIPQLEPILSAGFGKRRFPNSPAGRITLRVR